MASSSRLTYNKAPSNIFSLLVFPDIVQALSCKDMSSRAQVSDSGDTLLKSSMTEDQFEADMKKNNIITFFNIYTIYHMMPLQSPRCDLKFLLIQWSINSEFENSKVFMN